MKAFFFTAALAASLMSVPAFADDAGDAKALASKAKEAFAKREFSGSGIASAQEAADLYGKAAATSSDATEKAGYLVNEAAAIYFVGDASSDNSVKIEKFLKGIQFADQALALLGLGDVPGASDAQIDQLKASLKPAQLALLGEGLYFRGTNLGQWGQANGVVQSLSKWPELRRTMEIIKNIGLQSIHDYGANRVLGRGYFKIPGLLGGSVQKATELLGEAMKKTLVAGKIYSKNGYNTNYFAEVLNENGDTDKAKALLQAFIAADPASIDAASIPELKEAQRLAKEILKSF